MSSGHEVMLGYAWLTTTMLADTTLMGYATGGIWRGMAAPGTATPYIVMSFQSGGDTVTLNAYRLLTEVLYQVKIIGPSNATATLASAGERIDILFGGPTSGNTTGGAILSCYRQSPLTLDELVDGEMWSSVGGLYRLLIEQTS